MLVKWNGKHDDIILRATGFEEFNYDDNPLPTTVDTPLGGESLISEQITR